ncbi:MAG TPA: MFS transporter [Vicinamibacterales bacterium]|jgi:MFS family permease|nr:MFS transporter [Vicinamibacterales bacterium]
MTDPRDIIAKSPMTTLQVLIVGITIALNALDGFDVLSISFASPGIAAEWHISRAPLGFVLSMELIGMAFGSIFLGSLADRIGRRPTVLGCLVVMATGMIMVTTSNGVLGSLVTPVFAPLATMAGYSIDERLADLSMWRIVTGLGIGGMLAAINAVVAEFSNTRRRDLNVAIMSIGYPVGAALGGFITSTGLELSEWRSVFYFGATVTVVMMPIVYFLMPESVHWLARKQPAGALDRVNHTLRRLGHQTIDALPVVSAETRKLSTREIFRPGMLAVTVLTTLAYFFHITTFYYIVKWVPKIVVDMGFAPSSAGYVLSWLNVGGATGGTVLGLLSMRYSVKPLTIIVMLLSTIAVTLFGRSPADLTKLTLICMVAGFCTNASITGMYAIFAKAFPTHVRASGTGFAVGVGRGGSVLAPIIAGFLFAANFSLPTVSLLMGLGSLLAAGVLLNLHLEDRQ